MKKLFLVTGTMSTFRYGATYKSKSPEREPFTRIVWALDETHAFMLVQATCRKDVAYGDSVRVNQLVATAAIGTPDE